MYLVNMPSLHDQLKEIEEKKKDLEPKYSRFSKLDDIENFYLAGLLLSITVVVLIFIFIYRLFPGLKENGLFALFTLYGGGFAIALLHEVLPQTLRFVAQKVFKFDKEEYSRMIRQSVELIDRRVELQKQIKLEKEAMYRAKETSFAYRLNELVGVVDKRKLPFDTIKVLKDELFAEYITIKEFKLQLHTDLYYTNRFTYIEESIGIIPSRIGPSVSSNSQPSINITSNNTGQQSTSAKQDEIKREVKPLGEAKKTSSVPKNESGAKIESPVKKTNESEVVKKTIVPLEEVKIITEPFGKEKNSETSKGTDKSDRQVQIKVDFQKLNEHRHNIGELGEQYIFDKEKKLLISKGRIQQSQRVIHVSAKSDSDGYDIISFTDSGDRKYIEVKTTTGTEYEPFYLSVSEMEAMKRLNNYWIYRVYNFDLDLKVGNLYMVDCSKSLESFYQISPVSFRVTPKAK